MEFINRDCPTAVLVDVPSTLTLPQRQHFAPCSNQLDFRQEKIDGCKSVVQELKDNIALSFDVDYCSEKDSVGNSPKLSEINDQLSTIRPCWKTPSPKSMSRISKEASKVIHNLNSSEILDEDLLLTEEILPLSINFNIFDLEDSIEQEDISQTENNCENKMLNTSVSVQTQDVVIVEKGDQIHFPDPENFTVCTNFQESLIKSTIETNTLKVSSEGLRELDCNSKELFISDIYSDSLNSSGFSTTTDGLDDVFVIAKEISSEDKENIQREYVFSPQDKKIKSSPCKVYKAKTMLEFRGTLRNLSNITHKITNSTKCSSPNTNKSMIPPSRKLSIPKMKGAQPPTKRQQMASNIRTEAIPRSNSFQSTKQLISTVQKPCSSLRNISSNSDSLCESSSSDPKQIPSFSRMKTPSKRYSISTPLKSSSAVKPPMTPLKNASAVKPLMTPLKSGSAIKPPMTPLCSIPNPALPRFTPQSKISRLSLSKSWQQPTETSFSNSKSMKNQNNIFTIGSINKSITKINSGKIESNSQRRMSFSQSMSAASFRSLGKVALSASNKTKLCSKLNLPSPLPVGDSRKLARTLFPSSINKIENSTA